MTPTQMLSTAIAIAAQQFEGKFDRGGAPYILHCLKVMHYTHSTDCEVMAIAVLHDVVEDTNITYHDLRNWGMSERVIEGVRRMTKVPGETQQEYFDKVAASYDSTIVKLADLRHNSDLRRLKGVTEKDFQRMIKYQKMFHDLSKVKEGYIRGDLAG